MSIKASPKKPTRRSNRTSQSAFREMLTAIAERLFAEEGYANVSIRRITREAGCSPMTFYVYFESKRDVLRSIWDRIASNALTHCSEIIENIDDPVERLRAYCHAHVQYWLDHPNDYLVVFLFPPGKISPDESYYKVHPQSYSGIAKFSELAADGIAAGRSINSDAEIAGEALFACTIGASHLLIALPEYPWDRKRLPTAAVDLMIDGMFCRSTESLASKPNQQLDSGQMRSE